MGMFRRKIIFVYRNECILFLFGIQILNYAFCYEITKVDLAVFKPFELLLCCEQTSTLCHQQWSASPAHVGVEDYITPLERGIELVADYTSPPFCSDLAHQTLRIFMDADQSTIQEYLTCH
uniref:Uncharacterized protein n=1 Tax=Candidatus Methanogaster sp. ANME-2c ERB4 TaxID=2759911 RepID=A0A7G9YJD1_9EURY|nr:hypothetical protein FNPNCKDB_00006 [Methanosarcinales archaeon ANME-2c ERB4]